MILVNGESRGVTPLVLTLDAKKQFVGMLAGGWRYEENFYFVEAVPAADQKERYLSDSTYINPRSAAPSGKFHFELPPKTSGVEPQQGGAGRILGIEESLLPTLKSIGYVRMLQINGQPLAKWGASAYKAELPAGRYSIATQCKWELGIAGEAKIENMSPVKIAVENGKTYQLGTDYANRRCRVFAKASDK